MKGKFGLKIGMELRNKYEPNMFSRSIKYERSVIILKRQELQLVSFRFFYCNSRGESGKYFNKHKKLHIDLCKETNGKWWNTRWIQWLMVVFYDHTGFGFACYSTDKIWLVTHFENIPYDNALLLYSLGFIVIPLPVYIDFKQIIHFPNEKAHFFRCESVKKTKER